MGVEHLCDKALTIESHGRQIGELYEQGRDREGRMVEMETTLYGGERNGGGFIRETRETMEVVRAGMASLNNQVSGLSTQVKAVCDKKTGLRELARYSVPAIVTAAATVLAVLLK